MQRRYAAAAMKLVPDLDAVAAQFDAAATFVDADRRFAGIVRLYGAAAFGRLVAAHAVVVGVGGVGSWAAEALARSGVGGITLIDLDHVAESNINRQIHALDGTLGQAKVLAMAARIAAINPDCRINCIEDFVTPDNVATLLPQADVVIDCIDQVVPKAALLAWCRQQRIAVITCGAAGGRRDPTRIRRHDLARATGDPLLAKLRHRLRREHGFPRDTGPGRSREFGILAVFSDELVGAPVAQTDSDIEQQQSHGLACTGYGSSVAVTAPLGFAAAALALDALVRLPAAAAAVVAAVDGGQAPQDVSA
jgi:tRNA threonylcarbamoyladenosine dehydratase